MSTPSIENVLAAHQWCRYVEYGPCTCGDLTAFTADNHRAHVADAIRAHLAEHTDEAAGTVERAEVKRRLQWMAGASNEAEIRWLIGEWLQDLDGGEPDSLQRALSPQVTASLASADLVLEPLPSCPHYAHVNFDWLRALITEARDVRAALAGGASGAEEKE